MSGLEKAQWVALYAKLEKPLYNVVYRIVWDAAESQDIVQDAFLRCWQKRAELRAEGVKALVFRTAINLASNRRRHDQLWRFVGLDKAEHERSHDGVGRCDGALSRSVRKAIDALPGRLKRVLLLTEVAGMTYAEVAVTLDIKEGTVGSRRTRALAMLRRQLDREEAEHETRP